MIAANISSLPILNQKGKYAGMVEFSNLVEFLVNIFADVGTNKYIDVERLLVAEEKFNEATVECAMKEKNEKHSISAGYSLHTAWEILTFNNVHCIPVLNKCHQLCDIITESMLVDFLWQNIEKINKLADREVSDMNLEEKVSLMANTKDITLSTLMEMIKLNLSEIPIVDENCRLFDTISIRDLRGIRTSASMFWRLWSNVADYKAKYREVYSKDIPDRVAYSVMTDTYYSVVEKMATLHISHVFVVDALDSMKPIFVITHKDVLKQIFDRRD